MLQSVLCLVGALAAGVAAAWQLQPGNPDSMRAAGLLARQFDDECTIHSTCSSCFGKGYVICDRIGCFNPDIHQQCCSRARLCVGKTNKCCDDWDGPGVTGTSGVPNVTASPTWTSTSTPSDIPDWICTRGDVGEDCCQRAYNPLHWCSGEFPNFRCYNEKNQWCCTDGTVCDEEGCCDLFDASPTHPWTTGAVTTTSPATTTSSATGSHLTEAPTAPTATDSESTPESTTTSSSGASETLGPRGFMALGVAALGLGFL